MTHTIKDDKYEPGLTGRSISSPFSLFNNMIAEQSLELDIK